MSTKECKIVNSDEYKEYTKACEELKQYFKADTYEPPSVSKQYKQALTNYRNYLDSMDCKMPSPKWRYESKDKRTWKYSEFIQGGTKENPIIKIWSPNPTFMFKI